MSAERITYLDSSAIVKLASREPQSAALRQFLRRRHRLASSALVQTEVARALMAEGSVAVRHGREILEGMTMIRVSNRILTLAGELQPVQLRSLDAIHLASAQSLATDLGRVVTYDERLAEGARALRMHVVAPS